MTMGFFRSIVWFVLILIIGLGTTLMVANEIVRANLKSVTPILIRDMIGVGSHTLSGTVPITSSCDEVVVYTQRISDSSYLIIFNTWREPYITSCVTQNSTRDFRAIIFAASIGVSFTATLNGESIPIAVIPEIPLRGIH
ncbi:hypothetical protein HZC00_04325 [Candidatus Kaiserbacteria bacterium]|nr:hypothetical protein [Candidatus Kaiserbacteria bacterium]